MGPKAKTHPMNNRALTQHLPNRLAGYADLNEFLDSLRRYVFQAGHHTPAQIQACRNWSITNPRPFLPQYNFRTPKLLAPGLCYPSMTLVP